MSVYRGSNSVECQAITILNITEHILALCQKTTSKDATIWLVNNNLKISTLLSTEIKEINVQLKKNRSNNANIDKLKERMTTMRCYLAILRALVANNKREENDKLPAWCITRDEHFKYKLLSIEKFAKWMGKDNDLLSVQQRMVFFSTLIDSMGLAENPCLAAEWNVREFMVIGGWLCGYAKEIIDLFQIDQTEYQALDFNRKLICLTNSIMTRCCDTRVILEGQKVKKYGSNKWDKLFNPELKAGTGEEDTARNNKVERLNHINYRLNGETRTAESKGRRGENKRMRSSQKNNGKKTMKMRRSSILSRFSPADLKMSSPSSKISSTLSKFSPSGLRMYSSQLKINTKPCGMA